MKLIQMMFLLLLAVVFNLTSCSSAKLAGESDKKRGNDVGSPVDGADAC